MLDIKVVRLEADVKDAVLMFEEVTEMIVIVLETLVIAVKVLFVEIEGLAVVEIDDD